MDAPRSGKSREDARPDRLAALAEAPAPSGPQSDFTLKKAAFEIAIVAVGVLLALIVDEARQSRADRALAQQARAAMLVEIGENRVRLASKLALLHQAHETLRRNPAAGPQLVERGSNFQIAMTDTARELAVQTGALRHLNADERKSLAYAYASQDIYNQLLADEMSHWTALAAAAPGDAAVKLWMAYARRVAVSACITTMRIERFRRPELRTSNLQPICERYRLSVPPARLYGAMGLPMPNANWRPGGEY